MTKIKFQILLSLILLFLSFASTKTNAAELITNGSFETGNFTGWTVVNGVNPWRVWENSPAGTSNAFFATSPQDGTRSAWNGVAGNAGATFLLYQDVSIPAASTATFSWKHRFQLDHNTYCNGAACGTATFAVEILNTSNVLLQTVYSITIPPDTIYDSGWTTGLVSLNAYAGQTIRLRFRNTVTATYAGPGMAEIDLVSVQSPGIVLAANASVRGRVLTDGGRGISRASVTLTDFEGNTRIAYTNQFGVYYFNEIPVGQNYILTVNHGKYIFDNNQRVISVNEDLTDIDFRASP